MLVYNRVPKAGSTSMTELIRALAEVNMFEIHNKHKYYPDDAQLAHDLSKLRAGDVCTSTMPTFLLQRAPTPSTHLRTRSVPSIKLTYRALRAKKATHSTGSMWYVTQLRRWHQGTTI